MEKLNLVTVLSILETSNLKVKQIKSAIIRFFYGMPDQLFMFEGEDTLFVYSMKKHKDGLVTELITVTKEGTGRIGIGYDDGVLSRVCIEKLGDYVAPHIISKGTSPMPEGWKAIGENIFTVFKEKIKRYQETKS